jgi:hypothetical protein
MGMIWNMFFAHLLLGEERTPPIPKFLRGWLLIPICHPPFLEVPFLFPTYSGANPMGGNPQVTINPNTGLITGVPQFTGQYVVGVCVIERNSSGQILSILRRDFQFNVANCEPTVVADIQEDEIINGDDFLIVSCGENTVDFINESFQVAFINEVVWEFNIGGNTETYTTFDATVTFPGEGSYQGRLLLTPRDYLRRHSRYLCGHLS